MQIIETIAEIRKELARYRRADKIIGFISTLGNLHDGHISLIRKARDECDIVVAGIFLNPSHFGPGEDLEKYPRTFAEDCDRLRAAR
ncbi:MAG: pantoate--beta-alanine ligase, partial [Sulfurifustis sp.]